MLRTRLVWFTFGFASTTDIMSQFVYKDLLLDRHSLSLQVLFSNKFSILCLFFLIFDLVRLQFNVSVCLQRSIARSSLSFSLDLLLDRHSLSLQLKQQFDSLESRVSNLESVSPKVKIAMVGKYVGLTDSYLSVVKSLLHACIACSLKPSIEWIAASDLEDESARLTPEAHAKAWETLRVIPAENIVSTFHGTHKQTFPSQKAVDGISKIKDGYNPATWMLEVSTSAQELTLGGDISYELFLRDSKGILEALRKRAHIMTDGFNSCKSVVCNFTKDAMYSFPNYPKKQLKLQKVLEKFLMFSIASSSWKPLAFPLSLVQALAKKKGSLLFSFAIYTLLVYLFIYLINLVLKSW